MKNSNWRNVKLGEYASFTTGKLDSNAAKPDGKYPFFTCSRETFRTDTFSFDTECVLLAGNNAAGIFPLKYFVGKFDAYQRTYIIEPLDRTKLSTRFLYYALRLQLEYMKSISTGAATKFLTKTILDNLEITIPEFETQRRIADILSAYDNLIENNARRIRVLEQMAQAVYQEWFGKVDVSADSLPKGWKLVKLSEIAEINSTSIKNGNEPEEITYIDIASVSTGKIDVVQPMKFSSAPSRARRIVKHGDVIWSTVRPNRKSFSLIINPIENMVVSTGFAVLRAKSVPFSFLYLATTTDSFASYLTNHATGAAYPAVNSSDFENAEIVLPSKESLTRFEEITVPMFILRENLMLKNTNLRQARDLLLPCLVSGEIELK